MWISQRVALLEQPEVDGSRVAILGHSMGSGAAMAAGIRDPRGYAAVVAVSPTGADVTPVAPRNLLLQAGSWEGRFVGNAEQLLATAGGASADLSGGRARRLTVIPNAEHITILFRLESHRAALAWLDQTFDRTTATVYADRRILWYLLHLVAWLVAVAAVAPWLKVKSQAAVARSRSWLRWVGLVVGPLAAGGVLFAANRAAPVGRLGGLQVGGAVALWLLAAGLIWLLFIRRAGKPAARDLAFGLGLFVFLWVAFGAMAQSVWVQWLLIPSRLMLWPLLAAGCLPWFLAAGFIQQGAPIGRRALWWLAQSVALVGGLFLALTLVPSLGFLVLLMPLLPVILGVLAVAGAAFDRAWVYGLGSALFFGWILAAVFPLAG